VAVPDELRGEEIKAYVVLQPTETPESVDPATLAGHGAERLAYFKVPRYWEYRDELPRTPSERVARHVLREEKPDLRVGSYDRSEEIWR
jgi:crotonobetaine/carnitine-CoA ligase